MKKSVLIIVYLMIFANASFSEELVITDIENHWAKELIYEMISEGVAVIDGTNFEPDKKLNQSEVIMYINKFLGYSNIKDKRYIGYGEYEINKNQEWYENEFEIAHYLGYIDKDNNEYFRDVDKKFLVKLLNNVISIRTSRSKDSNIDDSNYLPSRDFDSNEEISNFLDSGIVTENDGYLDINSEITKAEFYMILDKIFGKLCESEVEIENEIVKEENFTIKYSNASITNKKISSDILIYPSVSGEITFENCQIDGSIYILSSNIGELRLENTVVDNVIFTSHRYLKKDTDIVINNSIINDVFYKQNFIKNTVVSKDSSIGKTISQKQVPIDLITEIYYAPYKHTTYDIDMNYIYNIAYRELKVQLKGDEIIYLKDGRKFKDPSIEIVDGENFEYTISYAIYKNGILTPNGILDNKEGKYRIDYWINEMTDYGYDMSNLVSRTVIIDKSGEKELVEISEVIVDEEEIDSLNESSELEDDSNIEKMKNEELSEVAIDENMTNTEKRIRETSEEMIDYLKKLPPISSRGKFEYYDDLKNAILDVEDCIYILENYYDFNKEAIEAFENFERLEIARATLKSWKKEIDIEAEQYGNETREGLKERITSVLDKLPESAESAKKTTDIDVLRRETDTIESNIEIFTNWEGDKDEILNLTNYYRLSIAKERINQIEDMSEGELKLINKMNRKLQHYELTDMIAAGSWYRELLEFKDEIEALSERERGLLNKERVMRIYDYIDNAPIFAIAEYEFQNNQVDYFNYIEENRIFIPNSMSFEFQREYRKTIELKVLEYINVGKFNYKVEFHNYDTLDPTEYLVILKDDINDINLLLVIKTKKLFDYEDTSRYFGQ